MMFPCKKIGNRMVLVLQTTTGETVLIPCLTEDDVRDIDRDMADDDDDDESDTPTPAIVPVEETG